jgi:hypothetical protein
MGCREVAVFGSNIIKSTRSWVEDLDVTSHIFVAPDFAEVVEAAE